ncbi:hypothetical protein Tco_1317555 [Tanacetum coccineum]
MATLESCPKHNMIAYLEKTDGNTEFHEIIDFLPQSSIHYDFIVSHVVSTTFFEQFWMSAKSKTINNVRNITATVARKPVTISEASIRSDLLFDDADGIDTLNNQDIFDTIKLMGVFSFMVKKGIHFSGRVTPLFPSMLAQPTVNESEGSASPTEPQSTPSPSHHSLGDQPTETKSLSIPAHTTSPIARGEDELTLQGLFNLYHSLSTQVKAQAVEIKGLKAQIKKLKKRSRPVINHHKAWLRATRLKKRRRVSKQGRKAVKSSKGTNREKEGTDREKGSIDREKEGTNRAKESTDKLDEGTAEPKDGNSDESGAPTTVIKDDETIAQFLVAMSQNRAKQKGVEIKDTEDIARPRPTSTRSVLTLKPLPKIDPKYKGKKVLEEEAESDGESEGIDEVSRKFAQLASDEEIARKARIDADRILAESLQEEEIEMFTIEERAKLLHDTIAAQRSVALGLGLLEDHWPRSLSDLVRQLESRQHQYMSIFGTKGYNQLYSSVRLAGEWMEMPATGLVIASTYNKVVVSLSNDGGCTTIFPLWSNPPQSDSDEIILIAHVNGDHYIRVALREGFPLPITHPLWVTYRSNITSEWGEKYVSRQNDFHKYYFRDPESYDLT